MSANEKRATEDRGWRQPVIPRGEVPCVWMTAGVLSFRLCDRDMDCAGCPLDRALRNTPEPASGKTSREQRPVTSSGCVLPEQLFISGAHLWTRLRPGGEMELGIDDLARRLLGRARGFRLPIEGEELVEGRPAFEAVTRIGTIGFPAPFDGVVVRTNSRLKEHPEAVSESPYEEGWILRGVTPDPMAALAPLTRGEPARTLLERDCRRARDLVDIAHSFLESAATVPDGGRLDESPLAEVPAPVARQILSKILHCTVRFSK